MSVNDKYLLAQMRFAAAELIGLAVTILLYFLVVYTEGGISFSQLTGRWEIGLHRVVIKGLLWFGVVYMLLYIRIARKICWTSLFGSSSGLYSSLPVSVSAAVTSKIFLLGAVLTIPCAMVPNLGNAMTEGLFFSRFRLPEVLIQLLVNGGMAAEKAPAVLALGTLFLLLAGFTVSSAILFAVVDCQCKRGSSLRQFVELVVLVGAVCGILTIPWFKISWVDSDYPLLLPLVMLLWELMLLVGAGRGCVRLLKYK